MVTCKELTGNIECGKKAVFNVGKNLPGNTCAKHKKKGFYDIYGYKCQDTECIKNATFGYQKRLYCVDHKKSDMKSLVGKKCKQCDKRASFNYSGLQKEYCLDHKLEEMVDTAHKSEVCMYISDDNVKCTKRSSFGEKGDDKKEKKYCKDHIQLLNTHVNFSVKKCNTEHCNEIAKFNFQDKVKLFCREHKSDGMVNVTKHCLECDTSPSFNYVYEKTPYYCSKHKKDGMVDVHNPKCKENNCNNYSIFGYKISTHCSSHKSNDMIDLRHSKCIECHNISINSDNRYRKHCIRCFLYKFPDEPIAYTCKLKEKHTMDFIQETFPDQTIFFDKKVDGGCSKRRPDCYIDKLLFIIIIECDENQHNNYSCENKRMMELFNDFGDRPLVFIRFNPDSYIDNNKNKIPSCFSSHAKHDIPIIKNKDNWNDRLIVLKKVVDKYLSMNEIPEKTITIHQLFYNGFTLI